MKHLLKRIFNTLILITLCLFSIAIIISIYFDQDIENSVLNNIQKNINHPLELENVNFTIYDNFPSASVKITKILVADTKKNYNDTLLYAEKFYVEISLIDLIRQKYDIKKIVVVDGILNIKYDEKNIPNFLIFKKEKKSNKQVAVNSISLLNTKLNIRKKTTKLNMTWNINYSKINLKDNKYYVNSNGLSEHLTVNKVEFLKNKKFTIKTTTKITKDTVSILNSNLDIENNIFELSGKIYNGEYLDLKIDAEKQELNSIMMHAPFHIKKIFSSFIATGKISFNSTLKGIMNKDKNPHFEINFDINKGVYKLKENPFKLKNIKIVGTCTNGSERNFKTTQIIANDFNANTEDGYINGNFSLNNLNNYFLNAKLNSFWQFSQINSYFENSPIIEPKGQLELKTEYNGNIAFNNKFKNLFLDAKHKSNIKIKNVDFNHTRSPLKFSIENADLVLNNNLIEAENLNITIEETDLIYNGKITNLIPYILNDTHKISFDGDISSTYVNFSELKTISEISQNNSSNVLPNWIEFNTNINIQQFSYYNFIGSNLESSLTYKNQELKTSQFATKTLQGKIEGNFNVKEDKTNTLKLQTKINFNDINIRNSFDAFNSYGQSFIKKEELKGIGSGSLNIISTWHPEFIFDKQKFELQSKIKIEKGELINFKPLENLSKYVSLNELKHVTFSNLENTINVKNQVITIPTMEIKSSALSVFLSGTHNFNQNINYNIKLLLSELLSSSFREQNTRISDFGEKEENGKIFNTIYLKMTGDAGDPKISLDKIRFMEDVRKNIKQEKETLNKIIKEDILQNQKKIILEQGQDVEIEWDPQF